MNCLVKSNNNKMHSRRARNRALRLIIVPEALLLFVIIKHIETSSISQQQQQNSFTDIKQQQVAIKLDMPSNSQHQLDKHLTTQAGNTFSTVNTIAAQQHMVKGVAARPIDEHHSSEKQSAIKHYHQEDFVAKKRSDLQADDDQLPLATINNHSNRNNNYDQQVSHLRPPQYVDVSALVGRNASISSSPSSYSSSQSSSILSPKSRSGLPECATQQVCNAIFVRMNYTQRLCECSSNYNWKCSNNLDPQDGHTIELTRKFDKRIYTQIKTCEPLREVRACKSPTDWTLLALQSERSGKAHYVVVCKCPTWAQLEGPYTHNHPPYANIPGIRVYGMLCAHQTARSSSAQTYSAYNPALGIYPEFPWSEALNVLNSTKMAIDSH